MHSCTLRKYIFSRGSSSRRLGNDREGERSSHERDRDRDSFSRWRERQYYGPRRWLETALKDSWEKDSGILRKINCLNFYINCYNFYKYLNSIYICMYITIC